MVPAVILAAGRSIRMGHAKALLPMPDGAGSFVAALCGTLRRGGIRELLVVGRPEDSDLQQELARIPPSPAYVANANADQGQLSSLIVGLDAADRPEVSAVLVTPVDVPFVTPAVVAALLDAFTETAAPIVRAVHRGRHGHPVIFARTMFEALRRADPNVGAKAVLRAHESAIVNVEVADGGVLVDIDTPEDYARAIGRPL